MQVQLAVTFSSVSAKNAQWLTARDFFCWCWPKQKNMKFTFLSTMLIMFIYFDWLDYFQSILSLTPISFWLLIYEGIVRELFSCYYFFCPHSIDISMQTFTKFHYWQDSTAFMVPMGTISCNQERPSYGKQYWRMGKSLARESQCS